MWYDFCKSVILACKQLYFNLKIQNYGCAASFLSCIMYHTCMSSVMRKSVNRISDQVQHKQRCTTTTGTSSVIDPNVPVQTVYQCPQSGPDTGHAVCDHAEPGGTCVSNLAALGSILYA